MKLYHFTPPTWNCIFGVKAGGCFFDCNLYGCVAKKILAVLTRVFQGIPPASVLYGFGHDCDRVQLRFIGPGFAGLREVSAHGFEQDSRAYD